MRDDDSLAYQQSTEASQRSYEALCRRCGECCGANGEDPCANLIREDNGRYRCSRYSDRHGPQQTVSGRIFTCVNIRDVQAFGVFYNNCPYGKADRA